LQRPRSKDCSQVIAGLKSVFQQAGRQFTTFSYRPGSPIYYSADDTCQDVNTSSALLAAQIRDIRNRRIADHVTLVGHSLGGVLALDTVLENPDVVPFVSSVVTVDSPFGGINEWSWLWFGSDCTASQQLINRRYQAVEWQAWYDQVVPSLMSRGTNVTVLVNHLDGRVGWDAQCICDLAVNREVWLDGPNAGHDGPFFDPATVVQLGGLLA
jgi:pimeloyl-ACP methyl ester carboxylesterase